MNYKLRKKYLGVDWGEKRIGLALGDSETKVATPFRTAGDMAELVKVVKGEEIDVVVVGRPVPISNFSQELAKPRQFPNNLKNLSMN